MCVTSEQLIAIYVLEEWRPVLLLSGPTVIVHSENWFQQLLGFIIMLIFTFLRDL